jgi:hypothetical protein
MPFPSNLFNEIELNAQSYKIDPAMLVDEISSTEYYVGISNNSKDTNKAVWRIKKIWKDGTTWKFDFPDGRQEFVFVWNDRLSYTYA